MSKHSELLSLDRCPTNIWYIFAILHAFYTSFRPIVINSIIIKILDIEYNVRRVPKNDSKLHSLTDFRSVLKKQNMLLEMIHIIKSYSLAHSV